MNYEEAYSELYRALSGYCDHNYRVAVINQFEQAVVEKHKEE